MDDPKNDTCAVLDGERKRVARGRFDLVASHQEITFTPASIVTLEEMQRVAFLWPDGEEAIAVTGARACPSGQSHFHFDVNP